MGSLFVSYSSQDRAEVTELCDWLSEQGFSSLFLDFDPEHGIPAGANWEAELYAQLRRADGVLFVGSPTSVVSQWCFAEIAMARSLGKTIIPVAIKAGGSHPLLNHTQAVDLTHSDEYALERLRVWLSASELDPERTFDWDPRRSPFPGLKPFEERDAAVFFGRQAQIELLLEQMHSSRRRYTGRLIAVVGASGSGKSSLVRAGVLPRVRRTQPPWVVLSILRPTHHPLRQLAHVMTDAFREAGAPRPVQSVQVALAEGASGLVALADELSHLHPGESKPAVLVFVDQAEELITLTDGEEFTAAEVDERKRFLALLHGATRAEGPVWALLTLRSEFLSAFLQTQRSEFVFDDQLLVSPLDSTRLAEVIERPADRAGVSFAPGLVGRMVADTGGGDALPLLAHTLAALHERARMRRATTITIGDYEDIGGVVGALRRSADEEHRRLADCGAGDLVVPTLNRLATVGPDGQATRRRLARAVLTPQEDDVVEAFIDARLLTSTEIDGESVVEIAHEALLRQWPPLTDAIERDREEKQLRSELERAAQDWQRSERRDEYLLPAERLAVAARLIAPAKRTARDLTEVEQAFLAASEARQRAAQVAEQKHRRGIYGGLASALAVVSALAIVALIQRSQASDQRNTAQATLLATTRSASWPQIQVRAWCSPCRRTRRSPLRSRRARCASLPVRQLPSSSCGDTDRPSWTWCPAATGAISPAPEQMEPCGVWDWRAPLTPPTVLRGHQGPVLVAFVGQGRLASAGALDHTVRMWDLRAPRAPPIVVPGQPLSFNAMALADDGRHVASAGDRDGRVRVWKWRTPHTAPTILRGHENIVTALAFAGDSRHLASAADDGTVRVWDLRALHSPPTVLRGHRDSVTSLAFTRDGRYLAGAGERGGTVRVWDWRGPHSAPTVLRSHQDSVTSVVFARDGRYLASAADDGTVCVWDRRAPRRAPTILRGHALTVFGVAFAGDGRHLASAGGDQTVRLWDWRTLRTPPTVLDLESPQLPITSQQLPVTAVAFVGDGHHLASTRGLDRTVQVWDTHAPRAPPTVLRGAQESVYSLAFTIDGRYLAGAGERDGTVRVWDTRAPRAPPTVLRGHRGSVNSVAFTGDRRHLASAGGDGTVRVWDWRATRTRPTVLRGHQDSVYSVAFAPEGRHLASAGRDGTVRVWDWCAPRTRPTVLRGHQDFVYSLAFARDGRYLASAGLDRTVRVWDWRAPRTRPTVLRGHQEFVHSVAFARDGRHLASAGGDRTVRVWDWRAARVPPTVLRGHQDIVESVAFARDGRHLASAGRDGILRVWDCQRCGDINDVLKLARTRLPRQVGG